MWLPHLNAGGGEGSFQSLTPPSLKKPLNATIVWIIQGNYIASIAVAYFHY